MARYPALLAFNLLCAAIASPQCALAAEETRQLGAHEHGKGTLNIAIEGRRLTIELEAPGADIVGFEHKAASPPETLAVEQAKAALAEPLALFRLSAEAQCRIEAAKIEVESGHDHAGDADKAKHDEPVGGHSEFHAEYTLDCADSAKLGAVEFDFFKRFERSQALEVTIITPKGQTSATVTRQKPRLSLAGLT
jgi:Protein of unknown function (DUF2796)